MERKGTNKIFDFFVGNWFVLGLSLLLLKFGLYVLFFNLPSDPLEIFVKGSDFEEYITPIDNYFSYGTYSLDRDGETFAGRLPGFVFPYIAFRYFLSPETSVFLTGLFILFAAVIAAVLTLRFVYDKSDSVVLTLVAAIVLAIFPYYWHWDWKVHPNSLSVSCITFGVLSFYKFLETEERKYLLVCGFFLTWTFMLRGFSFLFLPIAFLLLLYWLWKNNYSLKRSIVTLTLLVLPFCFFESWWILRNAITLHRFVPLQTAMVPGGGNNVSFYYYTNPAKSSMIYVRDLVSCWGGDNFWYFRGDMHWLNTAVDRTEPIKQFPSVVFDSGIDAAELMALKGAILYSYREDLTVEEHELAESQVIKMSKQLRAKFMATKLVYYYTVAPFIRIKNFLFKNVVQDWPGKSLSENNFSQKTAKGISLLSYVLVLVSFLVLALVKRKHFNLFFVLLALFATLLVLLFSITTACHFVYFIGGYYCLGLLSVLLLSSKPPIAQ